MGELSSVMTGGNRTKVLFFRGHAGFAEVNIYEVEENNVNSNAAGGLQIRSAMIPVFVITNSTGRGL